MPKRNAYPFWMAVAASCVVASIGLVGATTTTSEDPGDRESASDWALAIRDGRAAMEAMISNRQTPGASVAVAVDGQLVWSEGFGSADLEAGLPATSDTRFGIGSISKTLTMAAVMSLVDEGRLDLDRAVAYYLDDFPHDDQEITLRRIAVHQSGLSDQFATDHYQATVHYPTVDSAYQEIKNEKIEYQPGSKTVYATGLYTIIGRVLEQVTGEEYLEVMQERVFGPAGMTGVVPNDPTVPIADRTRFYVEGAESGTFEPGPPYDPMHKLPGAGFLARAEDLARFGAALLEDRLFSAAARREMFRPVSLSDGESTPFALGLRVGEFDGTELIHLPGGGIGISSWLFLLPQRNLVVAILANLATAPVGGKAADEIILGFSREIAKGD